MFCFEINNGPTPLPKAAPSLIKHIYQDFEKKQGS
jgi:hypothetical protein